MTDRLQCLVPFCRRTIRRTALPPEHNEWICGKHWTVTSVTWRRRRALFRRRGRRDLEAMMWKRLKRQAIERAAGL
jgi:hypothetical protein